jgi:hypothetical protein
VRVGAKSQDGFMTNNELDTTEVIRRFNEAFQRHDPAALAPLVGERCVLENSQPAPDGSRHEGRAACLAVWQSIATTPGTSFDLEETLVLGERAIIFWRYRWQGGSVRGVNVMRVENGVIVEARGYVKGGGR